MCFRWPQAEAAAMLGYQYGILGSQFVRGFQPLVGIQFCRVENGCVRRSDAGKYFIVSCAGSSDGKCTGTGFDPGNDRFISKVGKSKEESYGTKSIIDLRRWDVYRNSDA